MILQEQKLKIEFRHVHASTVKTSSEVSGYLVNKVSAV